MAINERIRFLRKMRGLNRRNLGVKIGFPEKSADVRMAQYELGVRTPRAEITDALAKALDVSTYALTVPDIDSLVGVAHTLFALEDLYGLTVKQTDDGVCLRPNIRKTLKAVELNRFLVEWRKAAGKLENGEMNKTEYDQWRYNYAGIDCQYDEKTEKASQ